MFYFLAISFKAKRVTQTASNSTCVFFLLFFLCDLVYEWGLFQWGFCLFLLCVVYEVVAGEMHYYRGLLHFDDHSLLFWMWEQDKECPNMQKNHDIPVSIAATIHHKMDGSFFWSTIGKLGNCLIFCNLNYVMQVTFMIALKFCKDSHDHVLLW